jgi:spermidine synthase
VNHQGQPAFRLSVPSYLSVALVSGAIIAYEIAVMRAFSIGSWSHFGSMVISIALFGFGVFSTVLCLRTAYFKKTWSLWSNLSLIALGPLMVAANTLAQGLPFNAIFLISDPSQKWYLAGFFLLYFVPFLAGAMFLGLVFLEGRGAFGRIYFANMSGSGIGGLILLLSMYRVAPEHLIVVALALWAAGAAFWLLSGTGRRLLPALVLSVSLALSLAVAFPQIGVSPFKGVSYARRFPDSEVVYRSASPLGEMEVYQSSYFHFAPGLSDTAAFSLAKMPEKAFLGMYIDSDGPIGVMKDLPPGQTAYFDYLPMSMPYLIKKNPDVFIMQFGGGVSTRIALKAPAGTITAAEGNPAMIRAIKDDPYISRFTGRILDDPRIKLVPFNGRIFVNGKNDAYDIIDLSLADSTGLSSPGGFSITEKYLYTKESFTACMRALRDGGILSITVWNKEDPPKSTLKLLSTITAAAAERGGDARRDFFIAHTYLSTMTVLWKKGGFSEAEVATLRRYCAAMSFEVVYDPGLDTSLADLPKVFEAYRSVFFTAGDNMDGNTLDLSAGNLYRMVARAFIEGRGPAVASGYVFDTSPLTDNRPYFAGFIKFGDIPNFIDKLETVSDEWGYLLLWATLGVSLILGAALITLPVVAGWRHFFSRRTGKASTILYFACLGVGYIMVEVGMISHYMLILENPTVSASVLITGMLVFSGLGSFLSGRFLANPRRAALLACWTVAAILVLYTLFLGPVLDAAGFWPYPARIAICLLMLFPLAFAMGLPFPLGMGTLSKMGREHFFVWAWGINGSFSVIGSVLVPILSVLLGLSSVLLLSAGIYLLAVPGFFGLSARGEAGA